MAVTQIPVRQAPMDRMCWPRAIDNRLRRRWAPPEREIELLELTPDCSVADLGAGTGYYAREILRRLGPTGRLFLVDIDRGNLEIARQKTLNDPRVEIHVASAAHLSKIPSGSIDRVLMAFVLCCLVDKSTALSEAWRILRPGGRLVVTFPRSGRRWHLRRHSLGLTGPQWATLEKERAWEQLPVRSGWIVQRRRLKKRDLAIDQPE